MTVPAAVRSTLPVLVASIWVITLSGQRGAAPPQGPNLPAGPVAAPIPTISAEVTGPGPMFESLMKLDPRDDMTHFGYEASEYFISGTANGQPFRTRIVVRKPSDTRRFSGLLLAESMHPSGNAWMFHFTHKYSMAAGHVGLDILTSTQAPLVEFNGARYSESAWHRDRRAKSLPR